MHNSRLPRLGAAQKAPQETAPASGMPPSTAVIKAIAASRSTGVLLLADRSLLEVPQCVWDADIALPATTAGGADSKWWESAELGRLDLARNTLSGSLPEGLGRLTCLTSLDCSSNQLSELFQDIGQLSQLKVLACHANRLTSLPDAAAALPNLASLNCSNNQIQLLPYHLGGRQPQLAAVVASNNLITHMPPGLSACSSLVKLELANNRLTEIPAGLLPPQLTELDLSSNALTGCFTHEVGFLLKLRVLNLKMNKLTLLPASLGSCCSLLELSAGFNSLTSIPPELSGATCLRSLDVRNNRITSLDAAVCNLRLTLLDLTNNELRDLPPQLGLMTSLRSLPLGGNPLKSFRQEVLTGPISVLLRALEAKLPNMDATANHNAPSAVRSGNVFGANEQDNAGDMAQKAASKGGDAGYELALARSGLRAVPPQVWSNVGALRKLDLSGNPIAHMDTEPLAGCSALRQLLLPGCALASWPLPAHLACLPALLELDLSRNAPLRFAPPHAFICCPSLRVLNLAGVPAAAQLPPGSLVCLPQLEVLNLSFCQAREFPLEVMQLPRLTVLNVSDNQIINLPEQMQHLTALHELHLSNNAIATLPPTLGLLKLRVLGVEGNPLRSIRRPIIEKGTVALLQYLQERLPSGYAA